MQSWTNLLKNFWPGGVFGLEVAKPRQIWLYLNIESMNGQTASSSCSVVRITGRAKSKMDCYENDVNILHVAPVHWSMNH
jgi:hypothetical protein